MSLKKKKFGVISFILVLSIIMGLFSGLPFVAYASGYVEGDTWIGTDGQVMSAAEASQWNYNLTADGTGVELNGDGFYAAYHGSYTADGRINGVVPASINGLPVVSMKQTFYHLTALKIAPVLPNTVKDMTETFVGCINLVEVPMLPTGSLTNMSGTFSGCTSLTKVPTNIPDGVTSLYETFSGCRSLVNAPVVSNSVTDMTRTFYQCYSLKSVPNISSSATSFYSTFQECTSLTSLPPIPDSVTNMQSAFQECTSLVSIPAIPDNVSNLNMTFYKCYALTGEIVIPDKATNLNAIFAATVQPIKMLYSASNTAAESVIVPSNVTKVKLASQTDYKNSLPVESQPQDENISVSVSTTNGSYSVEVGNTLQFQATVNRSDLQYKWVVQDLFDTNGQANYYATIDSNGVLTGVEAGYAVVGLMVKYTDGTEHAYGLTLVEVTSGGQPGYSGDALITNPGSYTGGWNYGYAYTGSLGSWFDSTSGGLTLDSGTTGGTGSTGGTSSTSGSAPYPNESNAVTKQDTQTYEPSTTVSGSLFDKSKNHIEVGESIQIDVINLNPANASYKLVSKSLSSTPSVLINQDGLAVGNYDGASLILLLDSQNKIIDSMVMQVGVIDSNASTNPNDYNYITEISNNSDNSTSIEIIGLVEPITTLNVIVPLNINFTIDANRKFIASDAKIISNCPAPLRVSILNVEKGYNAPNLIHEDDFTEHDWNNLSRQQASQNIALSLNGKSLADIGNEIGTLKSGFSEPTELNMEITGKYGKAWSNKSNLSFRYSLVLLVEMQ